MNDDFEIKVTSTAQKQGCGCKNQDNYDYEYDDLMNYQNKIETDKKEIRNTDDPFTLRDTDPETADVKMWENTYETTAENHDDCDFCNMNDDNWTPCEDCGNPRVITYQKCVTCDENGNQKHKTMTIRIVKRF